MRSRSVRASCVSIEEIVVSGAFRSKSGVRSEDVLTEGDAGGRGYEFDSSDEAMASRRKRENSVACV